jgi:hypothetical protein
MKTWTLMLMLAGAATSAATCVAGEPLRDPMRPPSAAGPVAAAALPRLVPTRVTALFLSGERRTAIVDGRVVHAGERSGLCLVEEILDDGVRCRFPRSVRVVRLPQVDASFKKPAATAVAANGVPRP